MLISQQRNGRTNEHSFLDDLDRLGAEEYSPDNQDVLFVRAQTNGVVEVTFNLDSGTIFRYDTTRRTRMVLT